MYYTGLLHLNFQHITDETEFILSVWKGSYVCADDNLNITYLLNVSKAETQTIGTKAVLTIGRTTLAMTGTYATFAQILALQNQDAVSHNINGNDFTNVEINMRFISSLFMTGAVVFRTGPDYKSCTSELRRIEGEYIQPVVLERDIWTTS